MEPTGFESLYATEQRGQGDMGFYGSHHCVQIRLPAGDLGEKNCLGAVATVANRLDCLHWSGV